MRDHASVVDVMRRLLAMTRALSGARSRAEVARVAIRHGRAAIGAPRGYLYVLDDDGAHATLVAAAGYARATRAVARRLSLDEDRASARAMRTGEEAFIEDLAAPAPGVEPEVTARLTGTRGTSAAPLSHEGRIVGVVGYSFLEPRAWTEDERALVRAIAALVAQALERVLAAEARESERRRALVNQAYLAEASAVLASSLEWEDTLRTVARLAVPRIADWCSIELLEGGELRQLIVEHPDPAKAEIARDLRRRYPIDMDGDIGVPAVVRSGTSQLIAQIPQAVIDAAASTEELRITLDDLGLRSMMCVPLHGRQGVIGAMTFVAAESGRLFGPDDVAFAEALAVRAASAIENARLYRDADRFRRLVDAHSDAVLLFDPVSLRVSYASRGVAVMLGATAPDPVGATLAAVFQGADADRLRDLVRPITDGAVDARGLVLHLGGPEPKSVEVIVQGVRLPGEPLAAVAIARDVSERVEIQGRLRRLAESEHARAAELNAVIRAMGEGVLVCSADGTVMLANPAVRDLLGGTTPATYGALVDMLDDPGGAPLLGVRGGPVELRLAGPDERWLEIATYPVTVLPRQERHGTIVVARDITAARMSQALRETFIGVLSHELRTPITTIYGGAKLLARSSALADEDREALFTDIQTEAERLHRLVEDVIALQRFGEDGMDIGHEPVLLQRILPAIVAAEEARWPGARFGVEVPPGLPTVIADPTYVDQVVRNLLSNAAKYGGDGVAVRVLVSEDADEILVRIVDDGPGFPEDEADHLFELYFRSPRTSSRASGAGIGLFVCARLIRAMGGRIWARRPDGGGAEFGFALRRMDEEAVA